MLLKIYRTFRTGWQNFYRNGLLSVATISVIVVTLFIINLQMAVIFANDLLLQDVKDRVSISVYFKPETSKQDVMRVKDKFSVFQEIKSIEYVSKEEALKDFENKNSNNEVLMNSLKEIGVNPFEPTLIIKAEEPEDYEAIAKAIENSEFKEIISEINYHKYKDIINGLSQEINSDRKMGIILGLTLSFVAVLITFNSIKITMYSYRQEIEIMRLVGASNNYIRLPFLWEGILYGLISVIISVPLSYVYLKFLSSGGTSSAILPFSNDIYIEKFLTDYFHANIIIMILFQLGLGFLLGVISSLIAVRKYLKK